MLRSRWRLLIAAGLVAAGVAGCRPEERAVTVSAAVSLTDALEEAATIYRQRAGAEVRFNFGPSNVLARQIASGAPVDLFISADDAQMRMAAASGAIDAGTIVDLVSNHLAIVTRRGGPSLRSPADLEGPAVTRIAIGDPSAVPAGVYAKQFLQHAGVWDRLQPRLVPVSNVRAALAAAANGSADAAIVYESDAAGSSRVEVGFVVSGPDAPAIVYPAAIAAHARNRAGAERFLAFLRSQDAAPVFTRRKFTLPHEAPAAH